ncbi:hypothetical protein E1287_07295 [Actinomadura sp. KC06]|uniref:hypothetical protein n=1 Tax=Actinomadura sp. KC06 TaxID=2530369 RepID=UPI0010540652|nr:hypothetical protein [Actinomadura sp. KC06]TDD37854.1 hypothetical protein E1287_07295 [Actinomadura sp. KC06]
MTTERITATKRSSILAVPREILLDHGLVEPTEAERAEAERSAAEYQRRAAARAEVLVAAREQLAAITDPLARTILDLHDEGHDGTCQGDDIDGYEAERPDWPCRTVEAIAAHYSIPLAVS